MYMDLLTDYIEALTEEGVDIAEESDEVLEFLMFLRGAKPGYTGWDPDFPLGRFLRRFSVYSLEDLHVTEDGDIYRASALSRASQFTTNGDGEVRLDEFLGFALGYPPNCAGHYAIRGAGRSYYYIQIVPSPTLASILGVPRHDPIDITVFVCNNNVMGRAHLRQMAARYARVARELDLGHISTRIEIQDTDQGVESDSDF